MRTVITQNRPKCKQSVLSSRAQKLCIFALVVAYWRYCNRMNWPTLLTADWVAYLSFYGVFTETTVAEKPYNLLFNYLRKCSVRPTHCSTVTSSMLSLHWRAYSGKKDFRIKNGVVAISTCIAVTDKMSRNGMYLSQILLSHSSVMDLREVT